VTEHGDFSRAQSVVTKHVNVMSALSEQVGARHLMDVSTVRGHAVEGSSHPRQQTLAPNSAGSH
jgi:hypothetical protein